MAVADAKTLESEPTFIRPTERCFYCGEMLVGHRWIYWNGNDEKNQQIWMHLGCAKRLADHLTNDFGTACHSK
jgi:hypothetical protein